ncbi:MAG: suppressor of fused domain protein [Solirubrobacteraceae bacterium]|nr:suppressor of fused domain protein [Solirubrobacteraceae bacterium]
MSFTDHLERTWPDSTHDDFVPARAGVEELMPGFRVRRISPEASGTPWVYATCGAALAVSEREGGAEYVVLAPAKDQVLVEMLAALAIVNADPAQRLGVGSIIALGRPWIADATADHLLVLPPYPIGQGFEVYESDERRIVVLWLVPITAGEAQFVRSRGFEAFETLLQQREVNVADPARASVA